MDSAVPKQDVAGELQESVPDPPFHAPLSKDVPLPPQLSANSSVMNPTESEAQVQLRREESASTIVGKASTVDTPSSLTFLQTFT